MTGGAQTEPGRELVDAGVSRQAPEERGWGRTVGDGAFAFAISALPPLVVLAALFAAWEVYVSASDVNVVTLPAPSRILDAAYTNRSLLWDHSLVTLKETVLGLIVSIAFGVALALLLDAFAPARREIGRAHV